MNYSYYENYALGEYIFLIECFIKHMSSSAITVFLVALLGMYFTARGLYCVFVNTQYQTLDNELKIIEKTDNILYQIMVKQQEYSKAIDNNDQEKIKQLEEEIDFLYQQFLNLLEGICTIENKKIIGKMNFLTNSYQILEYIQPIIQNYKIKDDSYKNLQKYIKKNIKKSKKIKLNLVCFKILIVY